MKRIIFTDHSNTSVSAMLKEARRYKVLSAVEERQLLVRMAQGDNKARKELLNHNLRLAVTLAKRVRYSRVPLEDLITAGWTGIYIATFKYDCSFGVKFSTCAYQWIKACIKETVHEYMHVTGEPASDTQQYLEFDAPYYGDGECGDTLADFTPAQEGWNVHEKVHYHDTNVMEEVIRKVLVGYADVFIYYSSIEDQNRSIRMTACKFNITTKEVREIIENSRNILRKTFARAYRCAA